MEILTGAPNKTLEPTRVGSFLLRQGFGGQVSSAVAGRDFGSRVAELVR
jgi:hypothetical protein